MSQKSLDDTNTPFIKIIFSDLQIWFKRGENEIFRVRDLDKKNGWRDKKYPVSIHVLAICVYLSSFADEEELWNMSEPQSYNDVKRLVEKLEKLLLPASAEMETVEKS
jgi:hypothetical protein